jgi:adenylyltransferase/sulfurtransferase
MLFSAREEHLDKLISDSKMNPVKIKGEYMDQITATELKERLDAGQEVQIVDVRQPDEFAFAKIEGAKLIPLGEILYRMDEIDPEKETIVMCKMGGRSAHAIQALSRAGFKGKLVNLYGGILAWSAQVDPSVPRY